MSEPSLNRSQDELQGSHQRRSLGARFSVLNLLVFTALIAVGLAIGLAYRLNQTLNQQLDQLVALSGRLPVTREDQLGSVLMPAVADNFYSWHVNVPDGQDYDLQLGMGDISEDGIPPIVGSVRIPGGQHRVTLNTGDSTKENFRYAVYLDGTLVIEKTMGSDWMRNGWSSSRSVDWPRSLKSSSRSLQLSAQSYVPRPDFGSLNYFNGQCDEYVTRPGYRLWIDEPDLTYEPASPFKGFPDEPQRQGFGLRDGLRYTTSPLPYEWTFKRPRLETTEPVLRVEAEFITSDGTVLSSQTPTFQSWEIRNAAKVNDVLRWQQDPSQTTQTAFLHAVLNSADGLQPVMELKWDVTQPDAVGIRLADTPANDQIVRWRLRIIDSSSQLWRELQIGDRPWITPTDALNSEKVLDTIAMNKSDKAPDKTIKLELDDGPATDIQLHWQSNEKLPLQIVEQNDKRYAGLMLYQGLPTRLGIQIPAALKPKLSVDVTDKHPTNAGAAFPGGPVFDAIQIEFETVERDWIWLSAELKE
jgi:hypothetical protein